MSAPNLGPFSIDRMFRPLKIVREQLLRATAALNQAGISYAVIGGNAVAFCVATVDEGATRGTPNVDILISRADLQATTTAFTAAGFVRDASFGCPIFLDGPDGKLRQGVQLFFAGEKIQPEYPFVAPEIHTVTDPANFQVLTLDLLLVMKLDADRDIDATHIRDLIGVGLVDANWLSKLPPELAARLKHILDTPDG
jgi:hypothetical protein